MRRFGLDVSRVVVDNCDEEDFIKMIMGLDQILLKGVAVSLYPTGISSRKKEKKLCSPTRPMMESAAEAVEVVPPEVAEQQHVSIAKDVQESAIKAFADAVAVTEPINNSQPVEAVQNSVSVPQQNKPIIPVSVHTKNKRQWRRRYL